MACTRKKQCLYGDICPTARSDEYNLIDASCYKPLEQTNEEWFSGMYTEAKAEWLADHMKCNKCPQQNRCNGYHGGCVALMLEWLKQPHQKE